MHKYTHIESIQQVASYVRKTNADPECPEKYKIRRPVEFRGSVKLHGTNAGVALAPDVIYAQSRTRQINPEDDNYGFAAFIEGGAQRAALRAIEAEIRTEQHLPSQALLVLFGEWCGPGINAGTALSKLPERQFVLFGAKVVEGQESAYIDAIRPLEDRFKSASMYSIMDAPVWDLVIDFEDQASKEQALERATKLVSDVEQACPWGSRFGIDGTGEGVVFIPVGQHWGNSDLYFKVKGEAHKKVKSARSKPQIDPEVLASIDAFVEYGVTDARLEQGLEALSEAGLEVEMRTMGEFLRWIAKDVRRECAVELEASGLEWKQVNKSVTKKASAWFRDRVHRL